MAQVKVFSLGGIGHPCCCAGGPPVCNTTICVKGNCGGSSPVLAGATVTIKSGGVTIVSGTTDGTGCVTLNIGTAGSYTVVISFPGYTTNTSTHTLSCGGTTTISLTAVDTGYHCSCDHNCAEPVPDTLTGSDGMGSFTLTYQSVGGNAGWWGCASRNIMVPCYYDSTCLIFTAIPTMISVPVYFFLSCVTVGGVNKFLMNGRIPTCLIAGIRYYQDGQSCINPVPAGAAGFLGYGSSAAALATSCSPFDWTAGSTGNLGCTGSPLACGNSACFSPPIPCALYGCSTTYTATA